MEELSALIALISRNKVKQIEIIGPGSNSDSLLQKLYVGIATRKYKSDNDAMESLFRNSGRQEFYYKRLKNKLTDRLINTLFFIDLNNPSFSEHQRFYYSCIRQESAVKILLGQSLRKPAINLAEKLVFKALKYEETDTVVYLSRILKKHYGTIEGDKKKVIKFDKILNRALKAQETEIIAEGFFTDILINFANSKANNLEVLQKAKQYGESLKILNQEVYSYRLKIHSYLIYIMGYEISKDYSKAIEICKEGLSFFESKKNIPVHYFRFSMYYKMIACYIHLGNTRKAIKTAKECIKLVPVGSPNWFYALHYYLIAAFHAQNFNLSYEIFVEGNSKIKNNVMISGNLAESWSIFEAYISYFIKIGKIEIKNTINSPKFRINKFLNEVPIYSKDKRGTNISILILQILFLLQSKKYGEIIDRVDALKVYSQRYLRKDETFRSNCFIKMLMQIPSSSFHKARTQLRAEKYLKKLRESPLSKTSLNADVEIIPYEILWNYIMDSLENKMGR